MLSDKDLDKVIYAFSSREIVLNRTIVKIIAKRVGEIKKIRSINTPFSLQEAFKTSHDRKLITDAINETQRNQAKHFNDDFLFLAGVLYAGVVTLFDDKPILSKNPELMRVVKTAIAEATTNYRRLVKKPVYVLPNPAKVGTTKTYSPEDAYTRITQEAMQNIPIYGNVKGARRAIEPLFDTELKYIVDDKPVNAKTAVSSLFEREFKTLTDKLYAKCKELVKCDGVELSAHVCPAPDHAPAQGHQFSNTEFAKMQAGYDFVDVQNRPYTGFERQIGQWNCRHYVKPIIIGVNIQEKPDEELAKILASNNKGYTTKDGIHLTLYECQQVQNNYERRIREAKEQYMYYTSLNDPTKATPYRTKAIKLMHEYNQFSKSCGLDTRPDRARVEGYK